MLIHSQKRSELCFERERVYHNQSTPDGEFSIADAKLGI